MQANDLRPGMVIQHEKILWQCLESIHKTPGNLRAFVQAKMRNMNTGMQKEFRFASTETLERVNLSTRQMQFLYNDDSGYCFMDTENYEQINLTAESLGHKAQLLLPETKVDVTFFEEKPLGIQLPNTMNFRIVEAEPNMKTATATSSYKNAKIETGLNIKVPQFIEVDEIVTLNTETGEYLRRAKE